MTACPEYTTDAARGEAVSSGKSMDLGSLKVDKPRFESQFCHLLAM